MSSPTSRQLLTSLGGCYDRMACFTIYCSDWWGHSPFFTLICSRPETPLAQPVQAPTIKPQLLCSYSQLKEINRTKYWAVADLMSFGVLFFLFACVCSCHGTRDYSGSLHRSSQTEMIQQAISSSLPWTMLVWLQWTERHGPLLSVRVWAKETHTWRMERCNSLWYHSTVVRSEEETYTSVLCADYNFPSFPL